MSEPAAEASGEDVLFEGHPALVPSLGVLLLCIVTLGIALVVLWVRTRSKSYKITSQRIVIDMYVPTCPARAATPLQRAARS